MYKDYREGEDAERNKWRANKSNNKMNESKNRIYVLLLLIFFSFCLGLFWKYILFKNKQSSGKKRAHTNTFSSLSLFVKRIADCDSIPCTLGEGVSERCEWVYIHNMQGFFWCMLTKYVVQKRNNLRMRRKTYE